ncbi:MAG TPA: hypothetical protein VHW00_06290 [Thermoanaerobaculia bacterium]|nr:hypothetical protein [Thermoanaerobaculia bacterium]
MRRPNTTSLEFLRSEAGARLTRALVGQYIDSASLSADTWCKEASAQQRFDWLLNDFLAVLETRGVPYPLTFRGDLEGVYSERYFDLYPPDEKDACPYYLILIAVSRILAELTINVWKLERGELGEYPKPKPDRVFSFLHLQWAREAFGWWAANLAHLVYDLKYPPPCAEQNPIRLAMLENLDDATKRELVVLKPVELESGCPVC